MRRHNCSDIVLKPATRQIDSLVKPALHCCCQTYLGDAMETYWRPSSAARERTYESPRRSSMTIVKQAVADIFADARQMQEASLRCLAANDIRDAAEKAWCATMRASAALVFSRTGTEPETAPDTSRELRILARQDTSVKRLVPRYFERQGVLHGDCFYRGRCEPMDDVAERIQRDTGVHPGRRGPSL